MVWTGLKTVALVAAVVALVVLYALRNVSGDDEAVEQTNGVATDAAPRAELGDSDYLFAQDRVHTFELSIPAEDLARIDADPTAEEYVEGRLTFEGEDLGPVGVRYKGTLGAFIGCTAQDDQLESGGEKTCTKLSMKVKVNWDEPNREVYGQRRLQFHSHNLDPSKLRERLAYWMFGEMGVETPRSTHARLIINGEYVGLFGLTEQVDGRFTRDRFEGGTGNLYKGEWPFDSSGRVQGEEDLIAALRTNEDAPDVSQMQAFATELLAADDDVPGAGRRDVLEQWLDIEEFVAYAAVDRAIRHDDGPFHWYCTENGCGTQNYYWYQGPTSGRLHIIPWDMDGAFENLGAVQNPYTLVADGWGEITADCEVFAFGELDRLQRSASCDPLFAAATDTLDAEYTAAVDELLAGPLAADTVDAKIDEWAAQIEPHIEEAARLHDDAPGVEQWREAVEELRASLDRSRSNPTGV